MKLYMLILTVENLKHKMIKCKIFNVCLKQLGKGALWMLISLMHVKSPPGRGGKEREILVEMGDTADPGISENIKQLSLCWG